VIDFVLLAVREDFFMGVVLPAVVGAVVLAMIGNSLLGKWGYSLW
jgi:hypothetical protein